MSIDLFADTGHFDFYCFERHYGMLRGQINMYLPPGHPMIAIQNNINENGCHIGKKVYYFFIQFEWGHIRGHITLALYQVLLFSVSLDIKTIELSLVSRN